MLYIKYYPINLTIKYKNGHVLRNLASHFYDFRGKDIN